jgi:hypothetical protein
MLTATLLLAFVITALLGSDSHETMAIIYSLTALEAF